MPPSSLWKSKRDNLVFCDFHTGSSVTRNHQPSPFLFLAAAAPVASLERVTRSKTKLPVLGLSRCMITNFRLPGTGKEPTRRQRRPRPSAKLDLTVQRFMKLLLGDTIEKVPENENFDVFSILQIDGFVEFPNPRLFNAYNYSFICSKVYFITPQKMISVVLKHGYCCKTLLLIKWD